VRLPHPARRAAPLFYLVRWVSQMPIFHPACSPFGEQIFGAPHLKEKPRQLAGRKSLPRGEAGL